MQKRPVTLISGSGKGIGLALVNHYIALDHVVIGCSRSETKYSHKNYTHFCLDVSDEIKVKLMFRHIRRTYGGLDNLINNAGIASMNHAILTTIETVNRILSTNVTGTFLLTREAAKIMQQKKFGRIINFSTVATPLKLAGEAIYASSKAGVVSLTQILSKELGPMGITVNAIGPTPVKTDLIKSVPEENLQKLLEHQAIHRYGEFKDIINVVDFFLKEESDFITGQVIYLGGI